MSPLRSVGGRLALGLVVVVAGVLVIVYLIVVPSYERSLENNELRSLENELRTVAIPNYPGDQFEFTKQLFADEWAPTVNARIVVFDLQNDTPALLQPVADSASESDSTDVENDPIAFRAIERETLARGTVQRRDQRYAEVGYPVAGSVILLIAPLRDQLRTVALVRKRVFIAGGLAMGFAVLLGYAGSRVIARRIRRLEAAAERIAAGDFSEPVVDAGSDELGQLARTFERMRLRLATLDRARGEFIANASHELRTPLFSLGGFLELLDDPELDEATRDEFVGQMREQVARLAKLATDLLDLSRLDAGRLTVAREPLDLSELAGELASEFRPRAASSGHVLDAPEEAPVTALGDTERVLQIGRILVENALNHTSAGTTVRVSTAVDGGRATLTVADDGPGIPREAQQQVFERFYRLDGTRASGSGLGLAIARELAEVMGGRIELDSQNGWTLFTLVLTAEARDRGRELDLVP
jgi:signal transduction histidine kinase